MGSVQQCFSWELVAASIIWHRLQPGVTFVLQDGWLCIAWTLLTLSHWWASRRGYKRRTFPQATATAKKKNEEEIHGPGEMWFFFSIYLFIKLNFVSDIETHTLRKLSYKGSCSRDIEFARATAVIMPVYWERWKMLPTLLQRWWYSPLIDPHGSSLLISGPHLKLTILEVTVGGCNCKCLMVNSKSVKWRVVL